MTANEKQDPPSLRKLRRDKSAVAKGASGRKPAFPHELQP
jgi:hypothetical protein